MGNFLYYSNNTITSLFLKSFMQNATTEASSTAQPAQPRQRPQTGSSPSRSALPEVQLPLLQARTAAFADSNVKFH